MLVLKVWAWSFLSERWMFFFVRTWSWLEGSWALSTSMSYQQSDEAAGMFNCWIKMHRGLSNLQVWIGNYRCPGPKIVETGWISDRPAHIFRDGNGLPGQGEFYSCLLRGRANEIQTPESRRWSRQGTRAEGGEDGGGIVERDPRRAFRRLLPAGAPGAEPPHPAEGRPFACEIVSDRLRCGHGSSDAHGSCLFLHDCARIGFRYFRFPKSLSSWTCN